MRCPCRGCADRTITCHGVCKRYQDWKKEDEAEKKWLKSHRPAPPEGAKRAVTNRIKARARGWNGKRGSMKDYG